LLILEGNECPSNGQKATHHRRITTLALEMPLDYFLKMFNTVRDSNRVNIQETNINVLIPFPVIIIIGSTAFGFHFPIIILSSGKVPK